MKKIIGVFTTLAIVLCSLCFILSASAEQYSGSCGADVFWNLNTETGLLEITGTGSMTGFTSQEEVPWYTYHSDVATVIVGAGVTDIAPYAFYSCSDASLFVLYGDIAQVGASAFCGCADAGLLLLGCVPTVDETAFLDAAGIAFYVSADSTFTSEAGSVSTYTMVPHAADCLNDAYDEYLTPENAPLYAYSYDGTALGHDYTDVSWTPDGSGHHYKDCTRCGEAGRITEACSYSVVDTPATCTTDGYITYTCTICGDIVTYPTDPAFGHNYQNTEQVDPTCTEDGYIVWVCANCGDTYTEVLPATGHSFETEVVAPTCTEGGYTLCTCTVCGYTCRTDEVPALGHNYVNNVCTRCGHQLTVFEHVMLILTQIFNYLKLIFNF